MVKHGLVPTRGASRSWFLRPGSSVTCRASIFLSYAATLFLRNSKVSSSVRNTANGIGVSPDRYR